MIKAIEYVKDALSAVGKYVLLDGYTGRLAIRKGLNPNKYAVTGDFKVCVKGNAHQPAFPALPNNGGLWPLLLSGADLTDQEPDADDICTVEELNKCYSDFTFGGADDDMDEDCDGEVWFTKTTSTEEEKEEEKEKPSEGDELMDFFFSKKKKVKEKEEERKEWGKDGFEFF